MDERQLVCYPRSGTSDAGGDDKLNLFFMVPNYYFCNNMKSLFTACAC